MNTKQNIIIYNTADGKASVSLFAQDGLVFTSSHALRGNSYISVCSDCRMHSQLQVGNEIKSAIKNALNEAITNQISCKGLLDNSVLGEVRG